MQGPLDRRRFLGQLIAALAAVPVAGTALVACGDDDAGGGDGPATTGEGRSELTRVDADPALAGAAAEALNRFGTDLYRRLAVDRPTANLVLSPASVALALSMAAAGASGPTLDEMVATLRADELDLHAAMNGLDAALAARNRAGVELAIANSTWLQAGVALGTDFLDVLATAYGSGVELVDFDADPDGARLAINAWVADRTNDRIPELIPPDTLDEATLLVLVNAVYLNARWANPFDPQLTRDATFTTAAGDTVEVATMAIEATLPYATGDGWQAVELAYEGDELTMLLFLPEPGFLELFEEIFLVTDATEYLAPQLARVLLPRWDTAASFSLADQLAALGMPTAFTEQADFSAMTTDASLGADLRIGDVIHQANITVGEEGTEAAAATAVEMEAGSAAPTDEPVSLVFDRPFVFAIRDRATGAVVFLGRVADPRG